MSSFFKHKYFILFFRLFSFIFSIWGILEITGIAKNAFNPVALLMYTIQSNILVAVFFGVLLTKTAFKIFTKIGTAEGKSYCFFPRLSAFITMAIFITMLVFWIILAPIIQGAGADYFLAIDNLAVHLITPLLMLLDYMLFTERGHLKKHDTFLFLVIPCIYLFEAMIIGLTRTVRYDSLGNNSYYPYIFLDIDRFGALVIPMVLAIALFFFALALIWQRTDNKITKEKTR